VHALTERVEVLEPIGAADDDLPVEHVAPVRKTQLGEVAPERLAASRLEEQLVVVVEGQATETSSLIS